MKRLFFLTILFFAIPSMAHGATEFTSIVDPGASAESDYSSLSTWETGLQTNLTAPSTLVFSGAVTGTAPGDNATVTLYDAGGTTTGITATVVHTAKTRTQILLENISDTSHAWAMNETWRIDASNLFTIDDVTHDSAQVTAKCRTITGSRRVLAAKSMVTITEIPGPIPGISA